MAVNSANVLLGAATVSIGPWVTAGAAGTLVDVGHLAAKVELGLERENVDVESENSFGIVMTRPLRQSFTLKVSMLEGTAENLRQALSLPAANKTGTTPNFTLGVVDPANQYYQIGVVAPGLGSNSLQTITLWKCFVSGMEAIGFAKGEPQVYVVTFRVLRDDSIASGEQATKGLYWRRVDS